MTKWSGGFSVALVVALPLVGCEKKTEAGTQAAPSETVNPSVQAEKAPEASAAGEARASYDEEAFSIRVELGAASGPEGTRDLSIVLLPKSGFKVNEEYPIKFTAKTEGDVTFAPTVLAKEQASIKKDRAELKGKASPTKPGLVRGTGRLGFSVCTEERCLIEKRDLLVELPSP